jgi:hypothetical protein
MLRSTRNLPVQTSAHALRMSAPGETDRLWVSYLILLRMGFAGPPPLRRTTVVSYTTFSPLARSRRVAAGVGPVCFLWHFPSPPLWQRVSPAEAGDILSCGVRTFLSGRAALRREPERSPTLYRRYQRTGKTVPDQGFQNKMAPQKLQRTIRPVFLASCTTWAGNFMWQPPQAPFSTGTTPNSPLCWNTRS